MDRVNPVGAAMMANLDPKVLLLLGSITAQTDLIHVYIHISYIFKTNVRMMMDSDLLPNAIFFR